MPTEQEIQEKLKEVKEHNLSKGIVRMSFCDSCDNTLLQCECDKTDPRKSLKKRMEM